ncbi:MAG: hypothetical protein JWQ33_1378 [Ramlibacter sp.]|nr:hypothetical protein [Ramlibacter sp.]
MELFNLAVEQFDLSPIVTKAGARALSHMSDANTPN